MCPWADLEPSTVEFCEARVCELVREPSNAWSSLAFVAVGIYLLWRTTKDRVRVLRLNGIVGIMIGLTSFFFHATTSWLGEVGDLVSMYLLICLMLTLEVRRFVTMSAERSFAFFGTAVIVSVGLLLTLKTVGIFVFGVLALLVIMMELIQWRRLPGNYQSLFYLQGTFWVSWGIWVTDISRTVCNPDNHVFNGHAAWHMGAAMVIYFFYVHHLQFAERQATPFPEPITHVA